MFLLSCRSRQRPPFGETAKGIKSCLVILDGRSEMQLTPVPRPKRGRSGAFAQKVLTLGSFGKPSRKLAEWRLPPRCRLVSNRSACFFRIDFGVSRKGLKSRQRPPVAEKRNRLDYKTFEIHEVPAARLFHACPAPAVIEFPFVRASYSETVCLKYLKKY
jgi:hypothetical protein